MVKTQKQAPAMTNVEEDDDGPWVLLIHEGNARELPKDTSCRLRVSGVRQLRLACSINPWWTIQFLVRYWLDMASREIRTCAGQRRSFPLPPIVPDPLRSVASIWS